jgi:hypothetical protein
MARAAPQLAWRSVREHRAQRARDVAIFRIVVPALGDEPRGSRRMTARLARGSISFVCA